MYSRNILEHCHQIIQQNLPGATIHLGRSAYSPTLSNLQRIADAHFAEIAGLICRVQSWVPSVPLIWLWWRSHQQADCQMKAEPLSALPALNSPFSGPADQKDGAELFESAVPATPPRSSSEGGAGNLSTCLRSPPSGLPLCLDLIYHMSKNWDCLNSLDKCPFLPDSKGAKPSDPFLMLNFLWSMHCHPGCAFCLAFQKPGFGRDCIQQTFVVIFSRLQGFRRCKSHLLKWFHGRNKHNAVRHCQTSFVKQIERQDLAA